LPRTPSAGNTQVNFRGCRQQQNLLDKLKDHKLEILNQLEVARSVKRVTNLLHLLAGVALLATSGYFFHELGQNGRTRLQQLSVETHRARPAKAHSAGGDPVLSAARVNVYGVLGEQDDAAGRDDAAPAPSISPSLLDHLNAADAGVPNHFLHGRLSVETYQVFAFEVPPRAIRPELRGTFRPARRNTNDSTSVELLLLNDGEFARFVKNRPVTATFSSNPSGRGSIDWKLDANVETAQKYYLVFRNSSEGQGPSIVDADFTASFE
jgi:hypothetical protein